MLSFARAVAAAKVARKNIDLRSINFNTKHIEILSLNSSSETGICHIYFLPVTQRHQPSSGDAMALVRHVRPQVLFLGLDAATPKSLLERDNTEFGVAYKEGMVVGSDIFLGDITKKNLERCEQLFKCSSIHVHNELMVNQIWQCAKTRDSIVGVVDAKNLPGMVYQMKMMNLGYFGMAREGEFYKNYLLQQCIMNDQKLEDYVELDDDDDDDDVDE